MAHYVTKSPTGLTVTRNGAKFTFTWKIGDKDYGRGQQIYYSVKTSDSNYWRDPNSVIFAQADRFVDKTFGGTGKTIKGSATSVSISLNMNELYPVKKRYLVSLKFWVRGQRADFTQDKVDYKGSGDYPNLGPSNWSSIEWKPALPNNPKSLTATLVEDNRTRFSWEFNADAAMKQWFVRYEWETILLKNNTETNGRKVNFRSSDSSYHRGIGTSITGDRYEPEPLATSDPGWKTTNTYTRWCRIRALGVRGNSADWRYAKHVYAIPLKATNLTGKVTIEQMTMLFYMRWTLNVPSNRPVDSVMPQYCIGVPDAVNSSTITPPDSGWTDAPTGEIIDTAGTDGATFRIEGGTQLGQCVWVRVKTLHDVADENISSALLLRKENLNPPTFTSVTVDGETHMATVEATASSTNDWPNSVIIVKYFDKTSVKKGIDIAYIPHGQNRVTFQCPDWGNHNIYFQIYTISPKTLTAGVHPKFGVPEITYTAYAKSAGVTQGGVIPSMPTNVALSATDIPGTVHVTWRWGSVSLDYVEISWADHEDAWDSTSGPSTYTLDRIESPAWNISGLDTSKVWYVRLRFGDISSAGGGGTVWGAYSDVKSIDLSSPPEAPALHLSQSVITQNKTVKASWTYYGGDGSTQKSADLYRYDPQASVHYKRIYNVGAAQYVTINPKKLGWTTGNTYQLVLKVTSSNGKVSEYSEPVSLSVADPISISITDDSLVRDVVIVSDEEKGETRTITALTEMPLTVHVTGAGYDGTTAVSVNRLDNYFMDRPDEEEFIGYEDETIVSITQTGESEIVIEREDLIGRLDDGAHYRLNATVVDRYGQTASNHIDFEVCWSHQALMPEATVTIDEDFEVAMLTPIAVTGTDQTDVCDIYRLSADKPELVYEDAVFGQTYVDRYPTIGDNGGYRFVFKTANGDYITANNELAWIDIPAEYNRIVQMIDFGNYNVELMYNVDLSSNWSKDFKETKYLGGSVQGDWNSAVSRTSSITGVVVRATDPDTISKMRKLATYPGVCRVRSTDGSNYEANVQVSESRGHEELDLTADFTLDITRVDTIEPRGLSYGEWAQFMDGAVRSLAVFYGTTSEGETTEFSTAYTINYTVITTDTQVLLRITSIRKETNNQNIYATSLSLSVDGVAESVEIPSEGEIPLSIAKTWNRGSETVDKQIILSADFIADEDEYTDTKYTYVSVPRV